MPCNDNPVNFGVFGFVFWNWLSDYCNWKYQWSVFLVRKQTMLIFTKLVSDHLLLKHY